MKDSEQAPLHIPFLDSHGQETVGFRTPSIIAPSFVSIIDDPAFPGSPSRKIVKALGVGTGQIIAKADRATSGSTTDFVQSPPFDIVVTAGDLNTIGPLELGTPVPQP